MKVYVAVKKLADGRFIWSLVSYDEKTVAVSSKEYSTSRGADIAACNAARKMRKDGKIA